MEGKMVLVTLRAYTEHGYSHLILQNRSNNPFSGPLHFLLLLTSEHSPQHYLREHLS
jgi:hypothetical protein